MGVNVSSSRPLIGITPVPRDVTTGYGVDRADTAVKGMTSGVERAGGIPLVLPIGDPGIAAELVSAVDGIVFSGGQDLDLPGATGSDRWIDAGRDLHEFALWRVARERGLPILGVCRGLQLANVMTGGTLIEMVEGHDAAESHATSRHEVTIDESSMLAAILGAERVEVNTIHHQAIDQLGDGLKATAWGEDGVIEAAEFEAGPWFVGVQWHPELMAGTRAGDGLFEALVAQCAGPDGD
jgi:putative glutamine amidotransferase